MVEINKLLPLARTAAFGAVSLLAFIVFALSAHLISVTSKVYRGGYYGFTALGLATAILTLLTLPTMLVVSTQRRGAFSSFVAVEIGWVWFLWIMWLSTGGSVAGLWVLASCRGGVCSEVQIIEAFGFLNWLMLMAYASSLLVLSVIAHTRGHTDVWKSEVSQFDWTAPSVPKDVAGYQDKQYTGSTLPPQGPQFTDNSLPPQQGQYPPQGGPPTPVAYVGAPAGLMSNAPQV